MTYDESWDRPHRPGANPLWQESDCYWFYDAANGVGGFHRIGQTPAKGIGQVMLFVFEEGGERFMSVRDFPLAPAARGDTWHAVANSRAEALGDKRMRFTWGQQETEGDLEFYESFYAPRDWSRTGRAAKALNDMNADGHLECSGRVRGNVRVGGRTHRIDALAHRDRSWGPRDHSVVVQHRMFSGTVGPALSFAAFTITMKHVGTHAAGFVVRDGIETDIKSLDVLTTFENDGATVAGGTAYLTLADGGDLVIPCSGVQGMLSNVHDLFFATDTISTVDWNGAKGFCDIEVSNNPGRGSYIPTPADVSRICASKGLSAFVPYRFGRR